LTIRSDFVRQRGAVEPKTIDSKAGAGTPIAALKTINFRKATISNPTLMAR
jgi:hypothetical protein